MHTKHTSALTVGEQQQKMRRGRPWGGGNIQAHSRCSPQRHPWCSSGSELCTCWCNLATPHHRCSQNAPCQTSKVDGGREDKKEEGGRRREEEEGGRDEMQKFVVLNIPGAKYHQKGDRKSRGLQDLCPLILHHPSFAWDSTQKESMDQKSLI